MSESSHFVPASYLYDVEAGEPIPWDWSGGQSIPESQRAVERAVRQIEPEQPGGSP